MEEFEKFYNKALRFLSFRPRSEKEIKDNLKRKKAGSLVIDKVIIKLKEKKFINDLEFAKWWVEQRTNFKPRSSKLIKIELLQKGVSKEIIGKIYDPPTGEAGLGFKIDDLEQAKKLVNKRMTRFRNKFGMTREEIYQKLGGFLSRRGFDWETIKQAIDEAFAKVV